MKNTLIKPRLSSHQNSKNGIIALLFIILGIASFSCSKSPSEGEQYKVDEKIVEGLILSPDNKPIPGAVIIVKDATTGTVTDINGKFTMDLKKFEEEGVTLTISMIDYESTELDVKTNKLPIDLGKITLKKEAE